MSGYFHFVLGLDVSSSAALALYFKHLQENQEPVGFFQCASGRFPGRGSDASFAAFDHYVEIEGFQYCSYNPFAHADLNVEIAKNGRMKVYSVDKSGNRYRPLLAASEGLSPMRVLSSDFQERPGLGRVLGAAPLERLFARGLCLSLRAGATPEFFPGRPRRHSYSLPEAQESAEGGRSGGGIYEARCQVLATGWAFLRAFFGPNRLT